MARRPRRTPQRVKARWPHGTPQRATARRAHGTPQRATARRAHGTSQRAKARLRRGTSQRVTARLRRDMCRRATARLRRDTRRQAMGTSLAAATGWTAAMTWVVWRLGLLRGGHFLLDYGVLRPLTRPAAGAPAALESSDGTAVGEAPTWVLNRAGPPQKPAAWFARSALNSAGCKPGAKRK